MIEFDINGAFIEFDKKMNNYNSIRKNYRANGKKYCNEFIEKCEREVFNINELTEYAHELGEACIENAIIRGVETIISFKVLTVDLETFKDKYCTKYLNYQRVLNNLIKNATNSKNKKNHYLTIESLKPLIREIGDNLYRQYFNIHLAVIDVLIDENIEDIIMPLTDESIKISNALINNYKAGFINDLDEPDVIKQIISLNPYRMDLYEFIINEDGDFNRDIERLVEFIGEDIKPYKQSLIDKYIEECLEKDTNLEFIKEKTSKFCKYMGVSNEEIYFTRIDAINMFANA